MASPRLVRGLVFTLTVGLIALAAVYYVRRAPDWDVATRVIMALGFLAFSAVLVYAEWLTRNSTRR